MRNRIATDGSGPYGGFPTPQRMIVDGKAPPRRQPGDRCDCGHRRSEHRWGGKACRHINVKDQLTACDCLLFTNKYEPQGVR